MSGIELLDLILMQIDELRIPTRERELLEHIWVIRGNVAALKEAMEQAGKEGETDVQSGGNNDNSVKG